MRVMKKKIVESLSRENVWNSCLNNVGEWIDQGSIVWLLRSVKNPVQFITIDLKYFYQYFFASQFWIYKIKYLDPSTAVALWSE